MAVKGNQFKNQKSSETDEVIENGISKSPIRNVTSFFQNEKLHKITGLILLLCSAYLLIAFTSYIFTWKNDQDKLYYSAWDLIFNTEVTVENWLGKIGAIVSHLFIHKWFGIASYTFVYLFLLLGIKILFKKLIFPLGKSFKLSFFTITWLSITLGFLFGNSYQILGGAFGYHSSIWLITLLGKVGTGLLSFIVSIVFLVLNFNFNFENILKSEEKEPIKKNEQDNTDYSIGEVSQDEDTEIETRNPVVFGVNERVKNPKKLFEEEDANEEFGRSEQQLVDNFNKALEEKESEKEEEIIFKIKSNDKEIKNEQNKVNQKQGFESTELIIENTQAENNEIEPGIFTGRKYEEPEEEEINEINNSEEIELTTDYNNLIAVDESLSFEVKQVAPIEELSLDEINTDQSPYGEYDPTLELSSYTFPTIELLEKHGNATIQVNKEELEANKDKILETLKNYNIGIAKIKATIGPTVTLYEIVPEAGVRISKIKNLEDDIALSLSALGIRIIAPIPGKGTIGIEVPNLNAEVVSMRSIIASEKFQNSNMDLPIALGKTISNEIFIADLAKMPHLLMAGATGQGKSVGLNAILVSLLYKKHPSQIKFVLVDPKKVELTLFTRIERHFLAKLPGTDEAIITDTKKVVNTLNSLCIEMDNRYELLKNAQVRNIKEYNAKFIARKLNPNNGHQFLPYIVLVVDEFADLIMTAGKEVETPIARLAQLARAIGIHLIIATQRPSVNIITGTIKANFPARIAFRVSSKIDSRTILDSGGADQLIGRGDMLLSTGNDLIRLQCAFVDTPEVEQITEFIGSQRGYPEAFMLPEFIDEGEVGGKTFDASEKDPMFEDAARIIVQHQQGSASLLQRRLKLGYNRAGRIVDQLEAAGVIGPFEGSKARQVLISDEVSLEHFLKGL